MVSALERLVLLAEPLVLRLPLLPKIRPSLGELVRLWAALLMMRARTFLTKG